MQMEVRVMVVVFGIFGAVLGAGGEAAGELFGLGAAGTGGAVFAAAEDGGEILAGAEAAGEGDVGDGFFGMLAEEAGGFVDAIIVQILQRGHVGDFFTQVGEMGDAEVTGFGHGGGGPGPGEAGEVAAQLFEKQFYRSLGADECVVEGDIFFAEHLEDMDEELVDQDGQQGKVRNGGWQAGDERADFLKAGGDFRGRMPDGIFIAAEKPG